MNIPISTKQKKIIYYVLFSMWFIFMVFQFVVTNDFFFENFYVMLTINLLFFLASLFIYIKWGKEIEGDKYASNTTVRLWILLAFVCMTAVALIMAY